MTDYTQITKVLHKKQLSLFKKKGVVATGIGYKIVDGEQTDELALVCSVDKKYPISELNKQDLIPSILKGIRTDVVETGVIKALHTNRHRPAPGGVSVGHVDITAGTLGCVVKNSANHRHILSNSHVLACSNDASIGDPIIQPGAHDKGVYPADHIANLVAFVPISFGNAQSTCPISKYFVKIINGALCITGSKTRLQSVKQAEINLVDAAIAIPLKDEYISDEIMEIGKIEGVKKDLLGMNLKKSGRTTGLTVGKVQQINVTVQVQYGEGKIATFTDQIMAGPMCEGGDSGSAVLTEDNYLTGLLFAGSDNTTICNRIENVFDLLNITL